MSQLSLMITTVTVFAWICTFFYKNDPEGSKTKKYGVRRPAETMMFPLSPARIAVFLLKRLKIDPAVELFGVVFAVEEGAAQTPFTFLGKGKQGLAGADGAGQQGAVFPRNREGRAVFFLFSAVVKIPALHGAPPWERGRFVAKLSSSFPTEQKWG
ncbi:MAG: hypothetical protein ACYC0O_05515 [Desulfurivibrionaceae bacterium]|jgi:hypothetical protein|nr:hypothetical protein [Pseudomonadota bacterium]MDP2002456.1 hypothetical protein [Desulfurivibrionaceae bacterium]MDP2756294.1 hypothetical protein [Desulfurivibrionaceae bacterium]